MVPPQPSPCGPQRLVQPSGVQAPPSGSPQTPRTPPPPQVSGGVQGPQSIVGPQLRPCDEQEVGWQVTGGGGATHDARSKSMYSRIFSCGVKVVEHSPGN